MDTIWRFRLRSGDGLWFEPNYGSTVDIDTIDIADPMPNPEDLLIATEAFGPRRLLAPKPRNDEYPSDFGDVWRARRHRRALVAIQRLAISSAIYEKNAAAQKAELQTWRSERKRRQRKLKFARCNTLLIAALMVSVTPELFSQVPAPRDTTVLAVAAAARVGKRRAWGLELHDGTLFAVAAASKRAAIGALLLDYRYTRHQPRRHRLAPDSLPAQIAPFDEFIVPKALESTVQRLCRETGCAIVVAKLPPLLKKMRP